MRPQIMAEERNMNYVGIDIGSTASKVVVRGDANAHFVLPTGWSSKETTKKIREQLKQLGADVEQDDTRVVATGYGRVAEILRIMSSRKSPVTQEAAGSWQRVTVR